MFQVTWAALPIPTCPVTCSLAWLVVSGELQVSAHQVPEIIAQTPIFPEVLNTVSMTVPMGEIIDWKQTIELVLSQHG